MTVEHLLMEEGDIAHVRTAEFCETHNTAIRALLIERGFGEDCELTDDERRDLILSGKTDALTEITRTLMVGVLSIFGDETMMRHLGCAVCVLEGTPERAADEIAAERTRKN